MSTTRALDQLQQVHELNRVFLEFLQARVRGQRGSLRAAAPASGSAIADCLGSASRWSRRLPAGAVSMSMSASQSRPCTTADADFDEAEHHALPVGPVRRAAHEPPKHVSGAVAVRSRSAPKWSGCARRSYADLQQLACTPGVLKCAFRERHWFWHELFTATRPELRRQLTLMALQPGLALGWPPRRPPQPTA